MRFCPSCERPFEDAEILTAGGLQLTYGIGITYDGCDLFIPKSQQRILRLLMQSRFVSYESLIAEVCREETENPAGSVKAQICYLRKSLKLVGAPLEIINASGLGYNLMCYAVPGK